MPWYFYAILGPLLWAIVNLIDKFLIERFYHKEENEKESHPGSLVLFSSIFGLVVAVGILFIHQPQFFLSSRSIFFLIIAGALNCVAIILYLLALQIDEISSIAPMFLLQVVFAYSIGFLSLHETIQIRELLAMSVVVCGAIILSLHFKNSKIHFKGKSLLYISLACLLAVVSSILFKYVASDADFWEAQMWQYLGLGFAGIVLFIFFVRIRKDFLQKIRTSGSSIFSLNITSETITVLGNLAVNAAILLAPAAIVYTFISLQALYVFLLSLLLAKIGVIALEEKISFSTGILKFVTIIIMIFAASFLL